METLYRKVAISERMPKAKEMLMTSHGWSLWNGHQFEDEDDKPISYINYWLEEIPDPTAQLKADKAELLEALEKATDLLEAGFPEISAVKDFQSIIQKHKP